MNSSIASGVNQSKNGKLLAYIASRLPNIHLRKLLKVIYLIDEEFTRHRGFPLTWFDYYAWAKGPVAPDVYGVKNGAFSKYVKAEKNRQGKWIVNSVEPHEFLIYNEMTEFSEAEIELVDKILSECADKSADILTEITHASDSLWSKAVRDHHLTFEDAMTSDAPIDLSALVSDDPVLSEVFDEAKWNMQFQAMLNSKR